MTTEGFINEPTLVLGGAPLRNKYIKVSFIYGKVRLPTDSTYQSTTLEVGSNVQCEISCKIGHIPNQLSGTTMSLADGGINMNLKMYTSPDNVADEYSEDFSESLMLSPALINIVDFIKEADLDNPVTVRVEYGYRSLPEASSTIYEGRIFKFSTERDTSNNQPFITIECVNLVNSEKSFRLPSPLPDKVGNGTIFRYVEGDKNPKTYKDALFFIFNIYYRVYGLSRHLIQSYDDIIKNYGLRFSESLKELFDNIVLESGAYKYLINTDLKTNYNNKMYILQPLADLIKIIRSTSYMNGKAIYLSFDQGLPLWTLEKYEDGNRTIMFTDKKDSYYNVFNVQYIDDSMLVGSVSTPDNWAYVELTCIFSPYFLTSGAFIIQSKYFSTFILDQKIKKELFKTSINSIDKQTEKSYTISEIENNVMFLISAEIDFSTVAGSGTPTMKCLFSRSPYTISKISFNK